MKALTPTTSGIYRITDSTTGDFYIGSAVNFSVRFKNHRYRLKKGIHHNIRLQRIATKRGLENFSFDVLEVVCDREKLIEREQFYIDTFNPSLNIARNATAPTLGTKASAETRAKMSATRKGRKLSEEHKTSIRDAFQNYDTRARRSAAAVSVMSDVGIRSRISEKLRGKVISDETRRKLSEAAIAREARRREANAVKLTMNADAQQQLQL